MRFTAVGPFLALSSLLLAPACDYGLTEQEVAYEQAVLRGGSVRSRAPSVGPGSLTPPGASQVRTVTPDDPSAPQPSAPPADREVPHTYPGVGHGVPEPPVP